MISFHLSIYRKLSRFSCLELFHHIFKITKFNHYFFIMIFANSSKISILSITLFLKKLTQAIDYVL